MGTKLMSTITDRASLLFSRVRKDNGRVWSMRLGVFFLIAAISLQALTVIWDAQASAAASDDMIPGGVGSKQAILSHYDSNTNNFRDVLTYNGITRAELANISATKTKIYVQSNGHSWGWTSRFSEAQGQRAHSVAGRTVYSRPQSLWGYSWYMGWKGTSATRGAFTIMSACGNLLTYSVPTPPAPTPAPAATCDKLTITKKSRTLYQLAASGSAKNGATISEIHYYIFDANGKAVNANSAKGSNNSVELGVTAPGTYKAQAFAITSLGNVTSSACAGNFTVTEEQKPAIDITKTVNSKEHDTVDVGEEFTYEITVTNTGNVDLKDAVVTDTPPSEVTLVKGDAGEIKNNVWTYTISSLKVGQSQSFKLTAKYAKYASGTHKNTVCVDTPTVPGSPDDCDDATTDTHEDIEICDLNDNTIKTIDRSEYDESHMTTDKSKCGDMQVCVISDKTTKTIAKKDFDEDTMTTDFSKCAEQPVQPTVVELPKTGPINALSSAFGVTGLTGVGYAYVASRRNLR